MSRTTVEILKGNFNSAFDLIGELSNVIAHQRELIDKLEKRLAESEGINLYDFVPGQLISILEGR